MIDILKKIALVAAFLTALGIAGNIINNYLTWSWLIYIFKIARVVLDPLNLIFDIDTLIIIVGKMLSILISVWGIRAYLYIMRAFNGR
jgi:hypothetical protein